MWLRKSALIKDYMDTFDSMTRSESQKPKHNSDNQSEIDHGVCLWLNIETTL